MVETDLGLALNHIDPSAIKPSLMQRLRKRVRIHKRPSRRVHEHGRLLHLPQEGLVDDVVRRRTPGGENEHDVALACELGQRHTAELFHPVLGCERGVCGGVGRRGRVRGVETVLEAEGDEPGERRLRNAAETDEACGALGRGGGRAELGAAEGEGRPDEVGPLEASSESAAAWPAHD